jgi:F-type H+-transporting ATPase subunit b
MSLTAAPPEAAATSNFLLPNGTFFVELVIFLVFLALLWSVVIKPIQKVMNERAGLLRRQAQEAEAARERMREAEARYHQALQDARAEAARIREEAREKGQQVIDEATRQAQAEADRVIAEGRARLNAERDALVGELRGSIGTLALDLAGKLVGEPVGSRSQWRNTVDPFLDRVTMVDGRLRTGQAVEPAPSTPLTHGGVSS